MVLSSEIKLSVLIDMFQFLARQITGISLLTVSETAVILTKI